MTKIKTKEEALELANKIAKYAERPDFEAFNFESDFGKWSTDKQRKYYWKVVVEMQYDYFSHNLVKLCEFVFRALQGGLMTKEFIHMLNKFLYNDGKSTEKLKTYERENYHTAIREDMYHYTGVNIPLPNEEE